MRTVVLFVYGTLKRGQRNHHLLAGQRFLRPARTRPEYVLYRLGSARFPGMVHEPHNGLAVQGELWEVDEGRLPALDEFEGVPELFVRDSVAVEGFDGPVDAYLYNGRLSSTATRLDSWPPPAP